MGDISVSTCIRMEERGILTPIRLTRSRYARVYYDVREVEAAMRPPRKREVLRGYVPKPNP
jgi:hypothetical protein